MVRPETLAFITFFLGVWRATLCSWSPPRVARRGRRGSPRSGSGRSACAAAGLLTEIGLTRWSGRARQHSPRPSAACRWATTSRTCSGHDRRLPSVHGRGRPGTGGSRAAAGRRPAISPACCVTGSNRPRQRPGGRRAGVGSRSRFQPGSARRSQRPQRRRRGRRRRRTVGAADRAQRSPTAMTSPTTCCARRPTSRSARLGGGCSTAAWRREWSCSTPTMSTPCPRSWPSSTPVGAAPSRAVDVLPQGGRSGGGHALRTCRGDPAAARSPPATREQPRSGNRDRQELTILEAMAAPMTACAGYADLRLSGAGPHRRGSLSAGPQRVGGRSACRPVDVALRPGRDGRLL